MELIVTQQPRSKIAQNERNIKLKIKRSKITYNIVITEDCTRKISVSSVRASYGEILKVYYDVESLLMIFEGQFYDVIHAYDGANITVSLKERALLSWHSAKFMTGKKNVLIDFNQVINGKMLSDWRDMQNRLDLIHKMYLYCVSNVPIPIDMKCAFMIEAFSEIAKLLKKRKYITLSRVGKDESKLNHYLQETIKAFGGDIFRQELNNLDNFTKVLVDSRNRVAHLRTSHDNYTLDSNECKIYIMKLSLLYRKILFELLDIPDSAFGSNLQKLIASIDNLDTTRRFLKKLSTNSFT